MQPRTNGAHAREVGFVVFHLEHTTPLPDSKRRSHKTGAGWLIGYLVAQLCQVTATRSADCNGHEDADTLHWLVVGGDWPSFTKPVVF